MRTSAALFAVAALMATPAGVSGQTWVTVDATALATTDEDLAHLRAEHAAALNAGDVERLRALYSADAIAVLGDGVVIRGADDIGRYFQETFAARTEGSAVALAPQHFNVQNNVASETGSFSESRESEQPSAATGVYVTIYTRGTEGKWRIAMEVRTRGRDRQIVRW